MQLELMALKSEPRWLRARRFTRYSRLIVVGLTVSFAGLVALGAVAGAQAGAPASATASSAAQVGFERRVQLTPAQEDAQSEILLAEMRATAATTQRMLAQARIARDVVKTLCLNDKLSQVDVARRSATDRKASLHAAVSRGDQELSNHEFTILTVLKKRVEQLSAEANQCIGEEAAFAGATNVVTTIDTTLPVGDPTDFPSPVIGPVSGPPITASSNM